MVYILLREKISMSISKTTEGTIVKSKFMLPHGDNLYILIATPFMILVLQEEILSEKNFVNGWLLFFTTIVIYFIFYSSSKITINPDNFLYKSTAIVEKKFKIMWNKISKVVLTSDRFLVIYNNELDQDYSINLKHFEHDDIQILLNLLNQKIQVEIEPEIQMNEKFVLNNTVAQQQRTTSRRRVVNEAPMAIKRSRNVISNSPTTHKRNLELSENNKTDKTKHKRNLEL